MHDCVRCTINATRTHWRCRVYTTQSHLLANRDTFLTTNALYTRQEMLHTPRTITSDFKHTIFALSGSIAPRINCCVVLPAKPITHMTRTLRTQPQIMELLAHKSSQTSKHFLLQSYAQTAACIIVAVSRTLSLMLRIP